MQWSAEGIVLGTRRHGESSLLLELMTRERGRHLGLVRGGAGTRLRPVLQPGNRVAAEWRARLDEHLGAYTVEIVASRAAGLMASAAGLAVVDLIGQHLRLLPERDPHPALFDAAEVVLDHADDIAVVATLIVRLELALLDELGFGLDLSACAATGATTELTHVSPRTGRAVSRAAAEPYLDRLLRLPAFLGGQGPGAADDVIAGFALTGRFLEREVWGPRGLGEPDARARLRGWVAREP